MRCELCLCSSISHVDSHIVPRAFYEELKPQRLTGTNGGDRYTTSYRKGIYGRFLCEECERKFQAIDERAIAIFKQGCWTKNLSEHDALYVIENAVQHRTQLHKFALSLLWRASASGRSEFSAIRLGGYKEKLRDALQTEKFCHSLIDATGLYFREFRGGDIAGLNQAFIPYRLREKGGLFEKNFGVFRCHIFGFPYGELLVRLGGEAPSNGFIQPLPTLSGGASLWTCNLSDIYPHLLYTRNAGNSNVFWHILSGSRLSALESATSQVNHGR